MSLFQLNTPAFPASRYATLLLGVVGLAALNVLAVLFIGAFVHHYDTGLNWLIVGAAAALLGIPLVRFAATLLWQWVAGTTALNGPGYLFAKAVAGIGPCIVAFIAIYAVHVGKYVGAHIPPQPQGIFGGLLLGIAFLGLLTCLKEVQSSINQRRATA